MSVRIGFAPGVLPTNGAMVEHFWRFLDAAVRLGLDSLWLSDLLTGARPTLEPVVALAAAVGRHPGLKIGTSVLAMPLRQPVIAARQLATLDLLSGGRCFPAVGLGQEDPREYEACGVRKQERARRTDEAIALMRRLWTEEEVTFEGEFFRVRGLTIAPRPVQQPCPPVWIGGRTEAAQRRVGRLGDGWLASTVLPEEVARGVPVVFETAQACGREIEEDHIGVVLGFHIASTREEAAAAARPYVRPRPDAPFTAYSALGPAAEVAATVQRYVDAGASKFVLRPLCPPEQALEQLEALGREVVPHFHR